MANMTIRYEDDFEHSLERLKVATGENTKNKALLSAAEKYPKLRDDYFKLNYQYENLKSEFDYFKSLFVRKEEIQKLIDNELNK
jgi:nitrate reductase beta subunit